MEKKEQIEKRISEKMQSYYSYILSKEDCDSLSEDIADTMEEQKYNRCIREWLNGKNVFTEIEVNGFSLKALAESLDEEHPNIPIAALLLCLEENALDGGEADDSMEDVPERGLYRGISGLAAEWCVADERVIISGEPCSMAVYSEGKWFFFMDEQDSGLLRECQLWQILLLNPLLTFPLAASPYADNTAIVRQDDGSYLIIDGRGK